MIDNLFPCDIGAFVTIEEAIMKLRTVGLISALVLGLLATPFYAMAQQAGKVYRIGYLRFSCSSLTTNTLYIAFRKGLRELGYIEGQNFVIEYRCAGRKSERRPEIAAEMVRLKVDVIVAPGARGYIRALQRATRTIPIVMRGLRVDPVEAGFVDSLARPGGNITGLTSLSVKLHPKRLELLKEVFPRISRVVILWYQRQQKRWGKELEAVGQALGIQIHSVGVQRGGLDNLESVFSAISQERPDGLIVGSTGLTLSPSRRARVIEFTAKKGLPTIYYRNGFVNAGGLMSYEADSKDLEHGVATYVDKILKGTKPADLPVERPTKFDFVINLKTAKALGLTIPPAVLLQATKVIK
jgi:putative ABC transport system substrate-binding protein